MDNVAVLKEAKQNGFLIGKSQHFGDKQNKPSLTSAEPIKLCPSIKWWIRVLQSLNHTRLIFYSTYEVENESNVSKKPSVLVLGSGPIRIGQGVEFDYATVHSVKAIQAAGYEAIIMNSNPETVSTDFSVSDKLYFEPLTLEDVMNVIDLENPIGVIVQFGGQTAINLAEPLTKQGVKILGTTIEDLDRAENRDLFEQALQS